MLARPEVSAKLIAHIAAVAAAGGPCPTNTALGALVGYTEGGAGGALTRLIKAGALEVDGVGRGARRLRVAGGTWTGWSKGAGALGGTEADRVSAWLLVHLRAVAEAGDVCPSAAVLAHLCGSKRIMVEYCAARLVTDGRILITRKRGFPWVIRFVDSGACTGLRSESHAAHLGGLSVVEDGHLSEAEIAARRVDRDPCPRCAVRPDAAGVLRCGHARPVWGFGV